MKLYYAVNCGKNIEYKNTTEIWLPAKLYGEELTGCSVSNFGGITKDGQNVQRFMDKKGEVCIRLNGEDKVLYKIVASTFLPEPDGGYLESDGKYKAIHHNDNNSLNFLPENMEFVLNSEHSHKPHLTLMNIPEWNDLIEIICHAK